MFPAGEDSMSSLTTETQYTMHHPNRLAFDWGERTFCQGSVFHECRPSSSGWALVRKRSEPLGGRDLDAKQLAMLPGSNKKTDSWVEVEIPVEGLSSSRHRVDMSPVTDEVVLDQAQSQEGISIDKFPEF